MYLSTEATHFYTIFSTLHVPNEGHSCIFLQLHDRVCFIDVLVTLLCDLMMLALGATEDHLPMEGLNFKICKNFVGQNFFLDLWGDKPLGRVKIIRQGGGGGIFITAMSLRLLRISSGNVNASVVATCQYPQIY